MGYYVGQVCKVVENACMHEFEIGEEVIIMSLMSNGEPDLARSANNEDEEWYVSSEDVKPVEE